VNRNRFKIGDWVNIQNTVTSEYIQKDDKTIKKVIVKTPSTITGQIVGLKKFQLGTYNEGRAGTGVYYGFPDDFEPSYLDVTAVVTVWEIKRGMLNKVVYACDEDVYPSLSFPGQKIPLLHSFRKPWRDADKANLREEMRHVPRDSKGRWLP